MKLNFAIPVLGSLLLAAAVCSAQDAVRVAPDHYKILKENEYVRVIQNTLAPGDKDATHTHPSGWYYVTKPGSMRVVHADGKSEIWEAKEGEGGWLKTEGPHTSENIGKTTMSWVLVEVKNAPSTADGAEPAAVKKEVANSAPQAKK
jgi:oxalate decarboxylase/phosphoglucose isomerase-like protein (cupin superfamily)